jgi:hypothetical protein
MRKALRKVLSSMNFDLLPVEEKNEQVFHLADDRLYHWHLEVGRLTVYIIGISWLADWHPNESQLKQESKLILVMSTMKKRHPHLDIALIPIRTSQSKSSIVQRLSLPCGFNV